MRIGRLWTNLAVSKKLYAIVGIMAILVVSELLVLLVAMNLLSALRAFVAAEGLWSKAQKDAIFEIHKYANFGDPKFYQAYLKHMSIPIGDRLARLEIEKSNMDTQKVTEGLLMGGSHIQDIPSMIWLTRHCQNSKYFSSSIEIWKSSDLMLEQLLKIGEQIHDRIERSGQSPKSPEIVVFLSEIHRINEELTNGENQFSDTLGKASRSLERSLLWLVILGTLLVAYISTLLIVNYIRTTRHSLQELSATADAVSKGDFNRIIAVRSKDEFGQLAEMLNKMTTSLQTTRSEQQHAEDATRVKSLFLANMSHEIRTPLSAILGFVELLRDPTTSEPERLQYLDIVMRTGDSLATIINDILDLSKVESGKLEIENSTCYVPDLLKDLEELVKIRCKEKGIFLRCDISQSVPEWISTDPTRLRQILLNVIGNAIKFTDQGGVTVSCRVEHEFIEFAVSDTGIGIAEKNFGKLFINFSQVDLSIRKIHGGTGLGLILSRKLAQLLDGDVYLEKSEIGKGSTFVIRIALHRAEAVAKEASGSKPNALVTAAEIRLDGKTVLFIEDSPENQLLVTKLLSKCGADVKVASNGLEGMNLALAEKFDVVLMDMQMPVMDGYTATEKLRQRGYTKPILGLTAHAMKEDLANCLKAGCNEVLTKPTKRSQLLEFISKYSGN